MEKIKNISLADRVYQELESQILSFKLKSGDTIPEVNLAKQFGVSRTPIREAIHRLAEYGLVELVPNNHAIVYTISAKEANDIALVRIGLEELAINYITAESLKDHLSELNRLADECKTHLDNDDRASAFILDSLFHLELIKTSDNLSLIKLYKRLDSQIQLLRVNQNLPNNALKSYLDHHEQIIEYLKLGEKEKCKKLLNTHIYHDIHPSNKEQISHQPTFQQEN